MFKNKLYAKIYNLEKQPYINRNLAVNRILVKFKIK